MPFLYLDIYQLTESVYHSFVRILQISSANNFGGGERHLVDLTKGLIDKNHDVFVAARPETGWIERLDYLPEERVFRLPLRNSIDVFSALKLAKIIRENNIEIVHVHLARDYAIVSLAVRFAPVAKLILTRHVLFPMKSFQKIVLNNVSKAIAVSTAVKTQMQKTFPAEKIVKIHNGIATERFGKSDSDNFRREFRFENNIPFDAPFIGTIGELKLLKGQRDFILAAQIVSQKFPDAYFAIVGKDNSFKQEYRRELKRLVKVFELENRFLWLDWVEETATLLHALDVFVSASHSESFGLAILEAMASGTAIVSTETAGAKELLPDENLVPIENSAQLAEKICELLNNENLRQTQSKKLQKFAKDNFSLERLISETEDLYREALNV